MPLGCDAAGCGSQDHGTGRGGLHDHLWPPLTGRPCGAERANTCLPTGLVNAPKTPEQVNNRAGGERPLSPTDPQGVEAAFALLSAAQRSNDLLDKDRGATGAFLFHTDFIGPLGQTVRRGRAVGFARSGGLGSTVLETLDLRILPGRVWIDTTTQTVAPCWT